MGDEQIVISSGLVISPETVQSRSFTSAFRGYHPVEVRQFLKRVSDELAASAGREVELRRALQEALHRAAHPDLDEATLTNLLGEHAAKLLSSARETAASVCAEAEKQAEAQVRDAEARVSRMREEADGLMARRVSEADRTADSIRGAAEAEAEAIRERASAEAETLIESAKRQGKDMVAEARAVRERMLGDLARRRRAAQLQLEQLWAGRERLLAAYDVVQRTVDEATAELDAAEGEARLAAEDVARRSEAADLAVRAEARSELWPPPRPVPSPVSPDRPKSPALAPTSGLFRSSDRAAEAVAPARPPLRPQTVAGAVAGRMPSLALPAPAPPPPTPPPPPAPEPPSELATGEVPAITADGPPPTPQEVEALFARLRADEEVPTEDAALGEAEPAVAAVAGPAPLDPVSSERALEGRDELLDNLEAGLTRALKRVLQDEQNEVLDNLRRLGSAPGSALLPAFDVQAAAYNDAALPWLQQAARAGVGFVSDPASGTAAESDHPALDDQARALAVELVEPLRDRLERSVESGEEADDPAAVAERVRAVYRQWKVQQVEECARHAALTAFSVGAFAATPEVAALQWLVDDDGHCPDCDDNALAGPTAKGQPFPTGQLHPPAHPGCRCLLVAVGA